MQKNKTGLVNINLKDLIIGFLIVFIFVLFIIFRKEIRIFAKDLFKLYGLFGLAAFVIVMDTFIQPISPDLIIVGSTLGGANLIFTALIGGGSSILAGIIGYNIGRKIVGKSRKNSFTSKQLVNGEKLFNKYGIWAVAIGALSPVPYSAICWSAGIYGMVFKKFLITSLFTRIPRFFLVAIIGSIFS